MKKIITFVNVVSVSLLLIISPVNAIDTDPLALKLPDRLGKTVTGEEIRLSNFKGRVVVVSFWASWCAPCRKELPILKYLQEKLTPDNFQVILVNYRENRKTFRQLSRKLKESGLKVVQDKNGKLGEQLGLKGIPFMIVLNSKGEIKDTHTGYNEEHIDDISKSLLKVFEEDGLENRTTNSD